MSPSRGPGSTVVALALLVALTVVFVALGRWQLARADLNRGELGRFHDAAKLPALTLVEVRADPEAARYRRIELVGRYLSRHVLLDNMTRDGRAGFEVLTPFEPDGGVALLLVNRGWLAADPDRRVLPDVAFEPADRTRVAGRIADFPRAALRLGSAEPVESGARTVLSYPSVEALDALFEAPILPYQLKLDAGLPNGFARDWQLDADLPARNVGYALQWFAFAAIAGGGALVVGWRARRSFGGTGS